MVRHSVFPGRSNLVSVGVGGESEEWRKKKGGRDWERRGRGEERKGERGGDGGGRYRLMRVAQIKRRLMDERKWS